MQDGKNGAHDNNNNNKKIKLRTTGCQTLKIIVVPVQIPYQLPLWSPEQ